MSNHRYPPAYLRYLKARLWNLGQPGFWVTAIFLSVLGLGIREYLSNPDVLTDKQSQEVSTPKPFYTSLSQEEQAIAADIDNLPVLLNDATQQNLSVIPSNLQTNTQVEKSESFENAIKQQSSASNTTSNSSVGLVNSASVPEEKNPFVSQAENLMHLGTSYGNSQTSSEQTGSAKTAFNGGMGLANQTDKSQNVVTISPLQAAINQSTQQNLSSVNGATATQTNTMGSPLYGGATVTPPSNGLPSQTLPSNTGLNSATGYIQPTITNQFPNSYNNNQALPNVPPAIPVTPPVTSAVPNNIATYSMQTPNSSNINPVGYGNYGLQQQPNVLNSRPVPGLYGGVQINGRTFP